MTFGVLWSSSGGSEGVDCLLGDAMQALIVHDNPAEIDRLRSVLARRGFMVSFCTDQEAAVKFVRRSVTDLVVLKQVIDGRHTTSVALAAEHFHSRAATILLSDRKRRDAVELFELIPSLHAVLGLRPESQMLGTLAISAVQSAGQRSIRCLPCPSPRPGSAHRQVLPRGARLWPSRPAIGHLSRCPLTGARFSRPIFQRS